MELDLFLQEKAFKKHAKNIESIRNRDINNYAEYVIDDDMIYINDVNL